MAPEPPPATWALQDHSKNLRRVLCCHPKFRKLSDKNSIESFPWSWLKDFFETYRNQHQDRVALMRFMRAGLLVVIYDVFMDHRFQCPSPADLECLKELSLLDVMPMGAMWAHASLFCVQLELRATVVLHLERKLRSGLDGFQELRVEPSRRCIHALANHPILAHIGSIISSCPKIASAFTYIMRDAVGDDEGVLRPDRIHALGCVARLATTLFIASISLPDHVNSQLDGFFTSNCLKAINFCFQMADNGSNSPVIPLTSHLGVSMLSLVPRLMLVINSEIFSNDTQEKAYAVFLNLRNYYRDDLLATLAEFERLAPSVSTVRKRLRSTNKTEHDVVTMDYLFGCLELWQDYFCFGDPKARSINLALIAVDDGIFDLMDTILSQNALSDLIGIGAKMVYQVAHQLIIQTYEESARQDRIFIQVGKFIRKRKALKQDPDTSLVLSVVWEPLIDLVSHACEEPSCREPVWEAGDHLCTGCEMAVYCDEDCQLRHWKTHKTHCIPPETAGIKQRDPSKRGLGPSDIQALFEIGS